jgi:hypothetical protein
MNLLLDAGAAKENWFSETGLPHAFARAKVCLRLSEVGVDREVAGR